MDKRKEYEECIVSTAKAVYNDIVKEGLRMVDEGIVNLNDEIYQWHGMASILVSRAILFEEVRKRRSDNKELEIEVNRIWSEINL